MTGASSPAVAFPHPKDRHPMLGDVKAVDSSRPTQSEAELARELGPIYELMFGTEYRLLVVTGTELAEELWDESRFEKHVAAPLEKLREVTGDALFMAYNSESIWGIAHRILTPGFVKPAMAIYHDAMVSSIESMFEYWDKAGARPRVNLTQDLNSLTFELIGRAGFSTSFRAFDHGADSDLHPFLTRSTGPCGGSPRRRIPRRWPASGSNVSTANSTRTTWLPCMSTVSSSPASVPPNPGKDRKTCST